ncbi:MAG: ABC transporter permease [Chloroflexi bacterium]|nr:ABC transporter permease [Chloroflexota bacterium]
MPHLIRLFRDIFLRLVVVFLAVSLCSFFALDRPVLRDVYNASTHFLDFLTGLGKFWGPVARDVLSGYARSMILLISAMAAGMLLGVPLGALVALRPGSIFSKIVSLISFLGILTPSFLLGLAVMVFFVLYLSRYIHIQFILLRPGGNLLDPRYIIAPALTLAARPIAYITHTTATALREQLGQDYIRTAQSKGLTPRWILWRHIRPNVLPTILSAMASSLLFSLSSLPVVEFIFSWPGVGLQLLNAILRNNATLASFLLISVGLTLVLFNFAIELLSQKIDPRLQIAAE